MKTLNKLLLVTLCLFAFSAHAAQVGPAYGGTGGGGSVSPAVRSDTGQPAVFANIAARDAYAATTAGQEDAARIEVGDLADARRVFIVGTLNAAGEWTSEPAAYAYVNGAWVITVSNLEGPRGNTGSVGPQGSPGVIQDVNGKSAASITITPDDLDDSATTHKFTSAADVTKLSGIEAGADVTDSDNVTAAMQGATLPAASPSVNQKVLIQDPGDSDAVKTLLVSQIAGMPGMGGAVSSVNTQIGAVVLDPDDLDDTSTTHKFTSQAEITKLAGIEAAADVTDETNVVDALDGAAIPTATAVSTQKVLIQDPGDSDAVKTITVQDIANMNGAGGAVDSVNTQTGDVVLDPDDLDDSATTHKFTSQAEITKLAGIETGADVTDLANITSAISGASILAATAHPNDAVLIQDASSLGQFKVTTVQSIVDRATGDVASVNGQTGTVVLTPQNIINGSTIGSVTVAANDAVLLRDASDSDNVATATAQDIADLAPEGDAHLRALESALLGGATVTTDHPDDQIIYSDGYRFGIDYRTNVQGDVNDANHYNDGSNVVITGNNAANTIQITGQTNHNRLIALKLDTDTTRTGTGAMVVMFGTDGTTEYDFLSIEPDKSVANNSENNIIIHPNPTLNAEVSLNDLSGRISLSNTSSYWLLIEIIDAETNHRLVPVLMEVPDANPTEITIRELNDVSLDLSSISTQHLGISRSTSQKGRVDEFKYINHPSFLGHSNLAALLRDHTDDKWVFGLARLLQSATENSITLANDVAVIGDLRPNKIGGVALSSAIAGRVLRVNSAGTGIEAVELSRDITTAASVNVLTLPTDYTDFEFLLYTVQEDSGQITSSAISLRELEDNAAIANHRISGNDTFVWDRAKRELTLDSTSDLWQKAVIGMPR